jgi:hypothetical protein
MLGSPLEALLVDEPDDLEALERAGAHALNPAHRELLLREARRVTLDASRERWADAMENVLKTAAGAREQAPQ